MEFFFYGTLLDRGVRRAVIGPTAERLQPRPATLHGWRRVRLRGRQYPVIVPARGHAVDGCVFGPLPASAIEKLVRFEGPEYTVAEVEVTGASGSRATAFTFVGSGRTPPTTVEWRFEDWERTQRSAFLRRIGRRGTAG